MYFSLPSCCLLCRRSEYSPQHSVLNTLSLVEISGLHNDGYECERVMGDRPDDGSSKLF
jgi:hypothetical protein